MRNPRLAGADYPRKSTEQTADGSPTRSGRTLWDHAAEAVLPTGSIRHAFGSAARVRRWCDRRALTRTIDHLEELYNRRELDLRDFVARPGIRRERLRLRRFDGQIFLDRWGVEHDRVGGIFVHKMSAPDPGIDLHDHPWWFASLVLKGGYIEERAVARGAPEIAAWAEHHHTTARGEASFRRRWSIRSLRLDECHRITHLGAPVCWTLVVHGPRRRLWGFFLPSGWVDEHTYDDTVRVDRRDLWNEAV